VQGVKIPNSLRSLGRASPPRRGIADGSECAR
jgi:hypothetical protein